MVKSEFKKLMPQIQIPLMECATDTPEFSVVQVLYVKINNKNYVFIINKILIGRRIIECY